MKICAYWMDDTCIVVETMYGSEVYTRGQYFSCRV
jgi:hypothetical protein